MERVANWLFVGVLVCSTFVYAESIPKWVSYGLVVAAYATFTLYVLAYVPDARPIVTRRYVLVTLAVVWCIYLAHALLHLRGGRSLPGVLAAIAASAIGVVLVPQVIDRAFFFRAVSRVSAAVVLIGLPALVFGPFSLFGLDITVAPHTTTVLGLVEIHPLRSYYRNQNFLSVFLVCGLLASLFEFHAGRRYAGWGLVVINAAGLLAAYARAGLLIGTGGLVLWMVYRRGGLRVFKVAVVAGIVCAVLGVLVIVTVGSLLMSIIPTRLALWDATLEAIVAQPLFGYGQVPIKPIVARYLPPSVPVNVAHNGYLRVALATGVLGGLAYVAFIGGTLVAHLRALPSRKTVVLFVMALSLAGYMLTENFIMFGIHSSALLTAVTFGYAARETLQSNAANAVRVPIPSLRRWVNPEKS